MRKALLLVCFHCGSDLRLGPNGWWWHDRDDPIALFCEWTGDYSGPSAEPITYEISDAQAHQLLDDSRSGCLEVGKLERPLSDD